MTNHPNRNRATCTSTIAYLDTPAKIVVHTPIHLNVGWGDRSLPQELPVWTDPDTDKIRVTINKDGVRAEKAAWSGTADYGTGPFTEYRDWYPCDLPAYTSDVIASRQAVITAAEAAIENDPAIKQACDAYQAILADIYREHDEHDRLWREEWGPAIARLFRRKSVQVGEQTVPGKHCVRSASGKLLGYANCWDGRWLGTVEHI